MVSTALSLILAVLNIANGWLERQDAERLRNSGKLEEIARASRALQKQVERIHDVDQAILHGADPDWSERLRDRASSGSSDR